MGKMVLLNSSNVALWIWAALVLLTFFNLVATAEGQYDNTRCKCICPDPQVVINSTQVDNTSESTDRKLYINNVENPSKCTCDDVVLPFVEKRFNMNGKQGEFCPRCECKYESRSLTIIKVVVVFVIWIVSLLMIYMLFLMCLDPLLNKRIKSTAYQEHQNEDEDDSNSVRGSRTSNTIRLATSTADGPSSGVLNRVGTSTNKWKRQVLEQRRNIYDRHTMLN